MVHFEPVSSEHAVEIVNRGSFRSDEEFRIEDDTEEKKTGRKAFKYLKAFLPVFFSSVSSSIRSY